MLRTLPWSLLATLLLAGLDAGAAHATSVEINATITHVAHATSGTSQLLMIRLDADHGHGTEGCDDNSVWAIVNYSGTTPSNIFASVMSAYLSGRRVTVIFGGPCTALTGGWAGGPPYFGNATRPLVKALILEN